MESTVPAVSDGGTEASAPATFADVSWSPDASPASTPSDQPTTPADAVVPPDGTEVAPAPDRSPYVDRARFDTVNERMKKAEEFRQAHAWAETVDRTAVAEAQRIGQLFASDKPGFIREVLADAVKDPSLAPLVRSEAARLLGMRQQQAASPSLADAPLPRIELADGSIVDLNEIREGLRQEMEAKVAPALQTHEQFQKAAQQYEASQKAQGFAQSFYGDLSKLPGFKEHQAAIREELGTTQLETDHPAEVRAAALAIYNRVVVPKLLAGRDSKVLESLQQKAHAATSVNPGSAAPSSPRAVHSFKDLGPDAWR